MLEDSWPKMSRNVPLTFIGAHPLHIRCTQAPDMEGTVISEGGAGSGVLDDEYRAAFREHVVGVTLRVRGLVVVHH